MGRRAVEAIEDAKTDAERWLDAVRAELGDERRHRAYSAFRAVTHATRAFMPFADVVATADRLPPALRGVFLDGWNPRARAPEPPTREAFLTFVADRLLEVPDLPPEKAVRAVAIVLDSLAIALPSPLHERGVPTARPGEAREVRDEVEKALEGAGSELPEILAGRRPTPARRGGREGDVLASSFQKTALWVRDVDAALLLDDRERAFQALAAVLQVLRDRLMRDEAVQLAAQLPLVLRGFYFEGWAPQSGPSKERTRKAFLARVASRLDDPDLDPEAAVRAVFAVLARHVTEGELEDVRGRLPAEVRALWTPERAASRQQTLSGKPAPRAPSPTGRARVRATKKRVRGILARARARGIPEKDLPLLASRRRSRRR